MTTQINHTSSPITTCACPDRLHCNADERHPACEICDDCHSGIPAACLSETDYQYLPNDDDQLPPWLLSEMGY